ncbi:MAG: methyltransferase domain-containing protein [Desulfobacterales bacterium]|nr:methyltransferase domain-containing protein [Desulfobacterales bacterium]
METPSWHPGSLMAVSGAYWQTCTLHAGVKLDIFTLIGDQSHTAEALAQKSGADRRGITMLLNALAAMGLLVKKDAAYANTQAAATFLSSESEAYLGHMIMHHHHLVESWGRLDEAVMTGKPVRGRASLADPQRRESFLMGMFNNAMLHAPAVVKAVDLSGRTRLLDLGGGPGTYAIHFCQANPALCATVYDLPTTRPFAEQTIGRFGLGDRIDFVDGDYVTAAVPGTYDAVWMSHILHGEGPDDCARIVAKAVSALAPGGLIAIHDFILNDARDSPLFPALFSLNMLAGTDQGQAYAQGQIIDMLTGAGVNQVRRLDFKGPTDSGILVGTV